MLPQLQTTKEQAQSQLGLIKQALDASVKEGVYQNLDTAYAVTTALHSISNLIENHFKVKDEQTGNAE
jgi:hypothetical protein